MWCTWTRNYVLGKRAVMIIAEMLQRLQFQEFFKDKTVDQNTSRSIDLFQEIFKSLDLGKTNHWQKFVDDLSEFIADFMSWVKDSSRKSNQFNFWTNFQSNIVLIDLARSQREGNWLLHLSSVRQSLPLPLHLIEQFAEDGYLYITKVVFQWNQHFQNCGNVLLMVFLLFINHYE